MEWQEKRDRCYKAFGERFTNHMTPQCRVYSRFIDNCDDCSFGKWYITNPLAKIR